MNDADNLRLALTRFFSSKAACLLIDADGQAAFLERCHLDHPLAIFPGSFNPLHAGHRELAAVAGTLLQRPVMAELSIANVDKPPLIIEEAFARTRQFSGRSPLWLTRAPTFVEKARLFPGAVFVVGVDTAERILTPGYYGGEKGMAAALAEIAAHRCRFLVAGRHCADGRFMALNDLSMPAAFRNLFAAIAPADFQVNISSSELRHEGRTATPHHA